MDLEKIYKKIFADSFEKFDPFDAADRMVDQDGDGHVNYCEYKWDTNPRDPTSFPGQGELCDPFAQ